MTADDASGWRIDALDPATASEADLAAVYALEVALEREALPDEPVYPFTLALADYRRTPAYRHRRWWVAYGNGGELVGRATCSWNDLPENRSHCEAHVEVAAAARRAGLGTALFARAVEAASGWGTTLIDLYARVGGSGEPFLRAFGAERRQVDRRSVCRTAQMDRALLSGWVRRAGERAADYSLVGWDGPCPDEILPAFCELKAVMNTAPLGGLVREDDRVTPEQWREREATWEEQGYDCWTLCARHNPSGELAGLTELLLPRLWPEMAYQEDTGVWPKHRERGVGRWLKGAMALRLLDERPAVARIETWNAGSNQAMLAINEAVGFTGLENWGAWQVPVDRALAAVA
jgi:GNAT superfamily N-acetyltransferase